MRRTSPTILGILFLATLAPAASAEVLHACADSGDGAVLVCASEYHITNSPDGRCSGPAEGYYGIDSLYANLLEGTIVVSAYGESTCWSAPEGEAGRGSTDASGAGAGLAGHAVSAGWSSWTDDDGNAGSSGCSQGVVVSTPDEAHAVERDCSDDAPPHLPWGRFLP